MSNRPIIAISGKSGCGNSTVSRLLAEHLGFTLVNYTFRNMAEKMGIEFGRLRELAEKDKRYDIELDKQQIKLASAGNCVLGSRLAVWLCKNALLKVYLYASAEVRSERISGREKRDSQETLKETLKRDRNDQARYRRIYGIDTGDYSHVDLVINTEKFMPDQIVQIIVSAFQSWIPGN